MAVLGQNGYKKLLTLMKSKFPFLRAKLVFVQATHAFNSEGMCTSYTIPSDMTGFLVGVSYSATPTILFTKDFNGKKLYTYVMMAENLTTGIKLRWATPGAAGVDLSKGIPVIFGGILLPK